MYECSNTVDKMKVTDREEVTQFLSFWMTLWPQAIILHNQSFICNRDLYNWSLSVEQACCCSRNLLTFEFFFCEKQPYVKTILVTLLFKPKSIIKLVKTLLTQINRSLNVFVAGSLLFLLFLLLNNILVSLRSSYN